MFYKFIEKLNNIKKYPYYYISPLVYSIGDACEQISICSSKIKNKKIIVLYPFIFNKFLRYKMCNKSLFHSLQINSFENRKNISTMFINFLLNIEFFLKRIKFLFISKITKKKSEYDSFPYIGIHTLYEQNFIKQNFDGIQPHDVSQLNLSLKKDDNIFCEKILNNEKIPCENIVCLHVRDSGYKSDSGRKPYRNSNINNYIELIKYLINKNYFVVRMGNSSANKINFTDKNFFDYTQSHINFDVMDLYLISKCKFYVGTQSGILDLAYMFNKPVLTTNMCELFSAFPRKINDRGLFKKIIIKDTGQKVNLKEYIKMNYSNHDPEVEKEQFEYIENSSQELYDAVVEFENLFNSNKFDLSYEQRKINQQIKDTFKKKLYPDLIKTDNHFNRMENSKIALWVKSFKGSLCENYLNENVK